MNLDQHDFYGDNTRWFIGRVINNKDPSEPPLGRVQIRIYGIHSGNQEDIPEVKLPWAQTLLPVTEGGTSGIGKIPQVLPGALVFGIFLDGKTSQLPLVLGSLNQIETSTERQLQTTSTNTRLVQGPPLGQLGGQAASQPSTPQSGSDKYNYDNYTFGSNGLIVSESVRTSNSSIDARRFAAMRFFVENNYSPVQAAGIVGNLEAESNFSTTIVSQFAGEYSQGIAQWNPAFGRLQKLKTFATQQKADWRDFHIQLQFVVEELRGNVPDPAPHNVHNKLVKCSRFTGGIGDDNSTWVICRYYESPADPAGKLRQREIYANTAYQQFLQSTQRAPS